MERRNRGGEYTRESWRPGKNRFDAGRKGRTMVRREKTRAGLEECLVAWSRPGMVSRVARVDRFLGEAMLEAEVGAEAEAEAEAKAEAEAEAEAKAEAEAEAVPSIPG